MNLPEAIETEPLLFDKLISPLDECLSELDKSKVSQEAKKLGFALFVKLMLFRIFFETKSMRDLVRDLETSLATKIIVFPLLGLSTLHDAFVRYEVSMFQRLYSFLLGQTHLKC